MSALMCGEGDAPAVARLLDAGGDTYLVCAEHLTAVLVPMLEDGEQVFVEAVAR